MRPIDKEAIFAEIAEILEVDRLEVRKVVDTQFRFTSEGIKESDLEKGIRLPYFGRFYPNQKRIQRFIKQMMSLASLEALRDKVNNSKQKKFTIPKAKILRIIDTAISLYLQQNGKVSGDSEDS